MVRGLKFLVIITALGLLSNCGKKDQPNPAPPPPPPSGPSTGGYGGSCGSVGGTAPLTPNIQGYSATLTSSYGGNWGGSSSRNSLTLQIFYANTNYRFEDQVKSIVASGTFNFPAILDFYPTPFPQPNIPTSFCVSSASLNGGPPITGIYYSGYEYLSLTLQGMAQAPLTNPFGNGSTSVQYTPVPVRLEVEGRLSYLRLNGQVQVTVGYGNQGTQLFFNAQ